MKRRIATIVIAFTTLLATTGIGGFTQIPVAQAQVPVTDVGAIGATITGWLQQAGRFTLDTLYKTLLGELKRRLLSTITDQTVAWIRGGPGSGPPRFITNFGDTIIQATNAAVGDTLVAIGAGQLCQGLSARLILQLTQPSFQLQTACTLTQVVQNVQAFANNFEAGGWIGYQEAWAPQNNIFGASLLANDQLITNINKRQTANAQENVANNSFLATKKCQWWSLYNTDGATPIINPTNGSQYGEPADSYDDPQNPPPSGWNGAPAGIWKCTTDYNSTPGHTIAMGLQKAVYADTDFIISSNEITDVIGAIIDAAINRLAQAGVEGIVGMRQSETTTGTGNPNRANPGLYITTSTQLASSSWGGLTNATFQQTKQTYVTQISNALTALSHASQQFLAVRATVTQLQTALCAPAATAGGCTPNSLVQCIQTRTTPPTNPPAVWDDLPWATNSYNTTLPLPAQINGGYTQTQPAVPPPTPPTPTLYDLLVQIQNTVNNAQSYADLTAAGTDQITSLYQQALTLDSQATGLASQEATTLTDVNSRLFSCEATP